MDLSTAKVARPGKRWQAAAVCWVGLLACGPWVGNNAAGAAAEHERISTAGLYRASFSSRLEPIVINRIHSWVLHVKTAGGAPLEDAEILITGGMPAHNHGLPTSPRMTGYLGGGDYLIEGMKFHMGGSWEMIFTIIAGGRSDTVAFQLEL